jgi:hypothetical protein
LIFKPFFAGLASKIFKKCKYDPKKFILIKKDIKKRRIIFFTLISNQLKKFLKKAPTKSYKQNKFDEHE